MNNYSHLTKWSSTKLIFLLSVLFIGFGTYQRLVTPLEFNPLSAVWADPLRHLSYATILHHDPIAAADNIGYQLWLAVIVRLLTLDLSAIGVYTGLLSAITPWIWYRFLREAINSRLAALVGWAIVACLPSWIGIYSYLMTETLFLPLFGMALWFTWRALRKGTFNSFLLSSIIWTLSIITRPVAVVPAVISIARLLYIHKERQRKILALLLLAIFTFTPIAYRSYKLIGVFSPVPYKALDLIFFLSGRERIVLHISNSSNNEKYFWVFGNAQAGDKPFAPLFDWHSSRLGAGGVDVIVDIAHGTQDWSAAIEKSWRGWQIFFQMWLENVIFLLFGLSWPDCNLSHPWERLAAISSFLWAPFFLAIVTGNIIYAIKQKRIDFLPALVMAFCFSCLLIPCIPVQGRYRKPLEGLLIANALWLISPKKKPSANEQGMTHQT